MGRCTHLPASGTFRGSETHGQEYLPMPPWRLEITCVGKRGTSMQKVKNLLGPGAALLLAALFVAAEPSDEGVVHEVWSTTTQLFNGKDLSGWDGDERFCSVRDRCITG